jgi:uncharacterized pyridoxamine 5'-phosphate oxidase family protein
MGGARERKKSQMEAMQEELKALKCHFEELNAACKVHAEIYGGRLIKEVAGELMKMAMTTVFPEPEVVLQNRRFETNQNHPIVVACAEELGMPLRQFVKNGDVCINGRNKVVHMIELQGIEEACQDCERMVKSFPKLKTMFSIQFKFISKREVVLRRFGIK